MFTLISVLKPSIEKSCNSVKSILLLPQISAMANRMRPLITQSELLLWLWYSEMFILKYEIMEWAAIDRSQFHFGIFQAWLVEEMSFNSIRG